MIRKFSTTSLKMANKPLKDTNLFKPIKVGDNTLNHRISHLPCTRFRPENQVPSDLMLQYYDDRTKYPGTLVAIEATSVSNETGSGKAPGLYTDQQVQAWKKIVDKVHDNKSFISAQLWHMGRESDPKYLKNNGAKFGSASAIYWSEQSKKLAERVGNPIVEYTQDDIQDIISQFVNATKNAMEAGFDYVELHHGNGYIFEQFLFPASNVRTDKYGGSIENRTRFVLETLDRLFEVIPASKIGIKIAPYISNPGFLGFKEEIHPIVTYGYLLSELQKRAEKGNELAFISISDARQDEIDLNPELKSIDWIKNIWKGVIIRGGNYSFETGEMTNIFNDVNYDDRTMIGFGRHFVANPDLVEKLENGWDLNHYQRQYFYTGTNLGFNTYPKHGETLEFDEATEKARKPKALV